VTSGGGGDISRPSGFISSRVAHRCALLPRMGVAFAGSNGETMEIKTFGKSEK